MRSVSPNTRMELAPKLKRLMGMRRISQEELGQRIDVHQTQVSRWVNGKSLPDIKQATSIARALGVPLDYLADDAQDEPAAPELTEDERAIMRVMRVVIMDGASVDQVISAVVHCASPLVIDTKHEGDSQSPMRLNKRA